MKQLVINGTPQSRLAKVKKPVDLVNEKGRKLGTFTPEPICPWDPSITQEELDRRAREGGGKSLKEILKALSAE
jgi:hypothetical protein